MPATAGRVRMPANNRVHSSAALQTHAIWQSAIKYDPYAPTTDKGSKPDTTAADSENAYASFRGLLALARITRSDSDETRGACKKCGLVGHLAYQCRNFLSLKDEKTTENDDSALRTTRAVFEKMKKASGVEKEESEREDGEDEDEISSSDSDVDPEMERIIAERFGMKMSKKAESLIKKSKKRSRSSDDDDDEKKNKKHHHHKKRRRSHHHRRCDDESDSDRNRKHKRKRRESDSDGSSCSESSDDRRKKSHKHRNWKHKERKSVLSSGSESTGSSSDDDERKEKRWSRGHSRETKDCFGCQW